MTLKIIIMPLHIFKELPLDWARLSIDIEGTKRLILEFLVIKCKMDKIKKKKKTQQTMDLLCEYDDIASWALGLKPSLIYV